MTKSVKCFLILPISLLLPRIVSAQSQVTSPQISIRPLNPVDSIKLQLDSLKTQSAGKYPGSMPVLGFKDFESKTPVLAFKDFKSNMPVLLFRTEKPSPKKSSE